MAKRKKKRTNPNRVPRSEADCRQEWKAGVIEGLRLMECILLSSFQWFMDLSDVLAEEQKEAPHAAAL